MALKFKLIPSPGSGKLTKEQFAGVLESILADYGELFHQRSDDGAPMTKVKKGSILKRRISILYSVFSNEEKKLQHSILKQRKVQGSILKRRKEVF
jgi:hypothetical protein